VTGVELLQRDLPLSYAQERLWFLEQLLPGGGAYVVPFALRVRGPLRTDLVQRALDDVVARHDALRMRFPSGTDGRPLVRVQPAGPVPLERADAADVPAAVKLVEARAFAPFDLAAGPLVRALLIRLAPDDHVLMVALHHIVSDGWSAEICVRDLLAGYAALDAGRPSPLVPLPMSYPEYAVGERERFAGGPALDRDVEYWRAGLSGVPPLDLPTDRPHPPRPSFRGGGHRFRLDPELVAALGSVGRAARATPYMVFLSAYQVLLGRYARQEDFAVGTPLAVRTEPETEELIGLFVNTLVLRADLSGDPTFADLLARTRRIAIDGYAHQELPFGQLVAKLDPDRDVRRSPLFQVTLALQSYQAHDLSVPGLDIGYFDFEQRVARFDLELFLTDRPAGMDALFTYNADVLDAATVARMAGHFTTLLRSIAERPGARLSELALMDDEERRTVLERWNDTAAPYPDRGTLADLVAAQAIRTPGAPAVGFEDRTLTYAELDAAANRLAHHMRARGVGADTLVGICAERSPELVVGMLAVLKAGGAYLPLDPDHPAERLSFQLDDAAAAVVLTQAHLAGRLPAGPQRLLLDRPHDWAGEPDTAPVPVAGPDNLAYVIYTSGSTGRPKGVLTTHRGVVNRLDWMQKAYRLTAADTVLQKTPIGFDVSVWEFFWPLLAGARLVLARPGGHKDPAYLHDVIAHCGVTTVHFVPSMLAAFLAEDGIEACTCLRRVISSGEELTPALARRFFDRLGAQLHNLYGPTEAAIDVSAWHCTPGDSDTVPIGHPIQNIRLHVLDPAGQPVPVGVPGELHIGGVGLARGYLNRPELTASRFVTGPAGERLYRTGDLARRRPDGALEYLGRLDGQVKLRGVRIEPGEIEAVLREQPGVTDAVVIVREDRPGDKRLVGYVVGGAAAAGGGVAGGAAAGGPHDPGALRAALGRVLPDYLVPSAIVVLDALPTTSNGKLDRRALPAPTAQRDPVAGCTPPETATERAIAGVWREVLGVDRVGRHDDFFDLGGHSLLAMRVVARLREALPRPVGVLDLFRARTVAGLAALVEEPGGPGDTLLHELTRPIPPGERTLSLVCIPYGGGSAVVYQPLADALPPGVSLFALAIPGNDVGRAERRRPMDEVAGAAVAEVLDRVPGPLAVYGHCGVGGALAIEVARRLETAGRRLEAVYLGAIFPFARPARGLLARTARLERLRSDRLYANWMTGMGADLTGLAEDQILFLMRNMRRDTREAEEYFGRLVRDEVPPLRAPLVSVIGEQDRMTDYFEERYREYGRVAGTVALVVLDEAGHFFLKHRAAELAGIVTGRVWETGAAHRVYRAADPVPAPAGPAPSVRRFLTVAAGQLVSMTGSALTQFAIPIWIYLRTGSLVQYGLFAALALLPSLAVAPLAGAVVDRSNRRWVMLASDSAAGATVLAMAALYLTGTLHIGQVYALVLLLSLALAFQRLAYTSAVAQLVPKHYLGHANGVVQMSGGVAQFVVPLVAVGLLASVGLGGILLFDVVSYLFAVTVVALVRFPATMAYRRREPLAREIAGGFRYALGHRGFRAMLGFFVLLNLPLPALFLLISPLLLSFGTLATVGAVSFVGAVGWAAGGLAMAVWGGPRHRRMRGVLLVTFLLAAAAVLTGLRPSAAFAGTGVFGLFLGVAVMRGIHATIVQTKVPQRFHGRVLAINEMIAWSTLPLAYAIVVPYGAGLFEPLLMPHGALAGTAGAVLGVGPGRGIGLMYLVFGLAMAALAAAGLRHRTLSRFDDEVPDAPPDDLVGLRERERRRG
jgi:amino acid adenylation domain-containing protein